MKKKASKILFAAVAGCVAGSHFAVVSADAATYSWSPTAATNLLATQSNYSPTATFTTTPANADVILFDSNSTQLTLSTAYGSGTNPTFIYGTATGPAIGFNFATGAVAYTIGATTDIDNSSNGFVDVNVLAGVTAATETFNPAVSGLARTSIGNCFLANNSAATQLILNGGFQNQSTGAATTTVTWQLNFSGTNLTPAGTTNSTVENGVISDGTGGATQVIAKNSVIATLNGPNTYSGPTEIQPGNSAGLILGNKTALGTGTLVLGANSNVYPTVAANKDLSGANSLANSIDIFASNPVAFVGSNNLTFTGTVDLSNPLAATAYNSGVASASGATATVNVTNSGITTFGGSIINSGNSTNFAKAGAGLLVLGGSSSYSGTTTISQGNLSLQNSSGSATSGGAVALTGGGATPSILSGTGTSSGLLTVTAGGRIAPGINTSGTNSDFGAAHTLHLGTTGGLTLTSANLDFDLDTTSTGTSDQIVTGGTVALTSVTFNFNALNGSLDTTPGDVYTLISGFSNNAAFAGVGGTVIGGGYTPSFSVNPTANTSTYELDVAFTPTPEPSSLALFGLAGLLLGRRRRRGVRA